MRIAVTVEETFYPLAGHFARSGKHDFHSRLSERIAAIRSLDHVFLTALHEPGCAQTRCFHYGRPVETWLATQDRS